MELLGNYQSNLTAFLYAQLLAQLETSISQGEYAAGALFDTSAAQTIQTEGQNFTTITIPEAGNTAYAEDVNTPLNNLQARYTAIANEITSLQAAIPALLSVISKESNLLDKLTAAATGAKWGSQQPQLTTAQVFQWDFEAGHGSTSSTYPTTSTYQTDPTNGVVYTVPVPDASYVLNEYLSPAGNGTITAGIGTPVTSRTIAVKQISWQFTPNSPQTQFEEIYSNNQTWAYLSTLEPSPILLFGPPNIEVVLPLILPVGISVNDVFTVSGTVAGGSLPIYVNILFYPRQNSTAVVNATSNQLVQLSPYNITANTVQVFTPTQVYMLGTDYTVNTNGGLTVVSTGGLVGQSFTVMFEEYFPAYQCSIDQTNWSPIFMLDPNRPYPDDTTAFYPIDIQSGNFPLTDELGVSLGLYLQVVPNSGGALTAIGEMQLRVTTPGSQIYGENAQLVVSLERAVYMNGLQLSPFTNFPCLIQSIVAYGFTTNMQTTVLDKPVLLDREVTIVFPRQLVRQFVINLYQQNYELKEYIVEGSDALRRDTLSNLQATLPFSVQTPPPAIPQHLEGSLYEFGIQDILGIDNVPNAPGVFSSGPYLVNGMPEVIRLDAELINMSSNAVYLAFIAYDGNDAVLDQSEVAYTIGNSITYSSIQTGVYTADHVDFFVKFVFRNQFSLLQQLQLQVTVT